MTGDKRVYEVLEQTGIPYEYHEHPEANTIEEAMKYWQGLDSTFCKNLFFRNHKGNRHYLVILRHDRAFDIHSLEKKLKQGKLTFASAQRMERYLGLKPGSVSPFGLVNDSEHHVYLFIDESLRQAERLAFHPNDSRSTLIISQPDFERFLRHCGNGFEYFSPDVAVD